VESKKAALESARINLNWTTVTAPIAGRIGISSVTPGALVSADQDTALATIRGLDTMYVDLTRSSVDLLRLRKQSLASNSDTLSVTLTLEDGSTYRKKGVWRSPKSPSMNPPARSPCALSSPTRSTSCCRGCSSARIDEGIMNDAILAPQQGITRDAKGNATALVVDAANKVEQRTVETGDTYGDKWLVLSGLKAGDKLIVEGTGKVAPADSEGRCRQQ
jgi:membrane fusion protein (multidrug efflux system)